MRAKKSYRQKSAVSRSGSKKLREVVAANLRRIRTDNHISVEALARKAGYPLEFVEKAEKGELQRLKIADLEPFAAALEVDITALVKRPGSKGA